MSRLREIVRRHALAAGMIMPLAVIVHVLSPRTLERAEPLLDGDLTAGPYPLLGFFAWFVRGFPVIGAGGDYELWTGSVVLMLVAAAGILLAAWRITRNRLVAAAAAFYFVAHPLAVAAGRDEAGLRDAVLFVFLAWTLALAARPRIRSPRFPNRPPHPAPLPVAALLVLATLSTPFGWTLALVLIAFDVAHGAREGRSRRDLRLRGYAVHGAVAAAGVVAAVLFDPAPATGERLTAALAIDGPSARLESILTVRFAGSFPPVLELVLWGAAIGGAGLAVLDTATGIGRRRTLVPHAAFCGLALAIVTIAPALTPEVTPAPAGAIAAAGLALLLATLSWRLAGALVPELAAALAPPRTAWSEVRTRLALEPLPPLVEPAPIVVEPAPAAKDTPARRLEAILERLDGPPGASHRSFDAAAFDALVRPVASGAPCGVVVAPAGSPWASALVACVDRLTVVTPDGLATSCASELDGVPGITRQSSTAPPWHVADAEADVAVAIDGLEHVPVSEVGAVLGEMRRVLGARGRAVLGFPRGGGVDVELLPELMRSVGFAIESTAPDVLAGAVVLTVRRDDA